MKNKRKESFSLLGWIIMFEVSRPSIWKEILAHLRSKHSVWKIKTGYSFASKPINCSGDWKPKQVLSLLLLFDIHKEF